MHIFDPQEPIFWQMMWYLSILSWIISIGALFVCVACVSSRLSWRVTIIPGILFLIIITSCIIVSIRLYAIDSLSFDARVFWPTTVFLSYLFLITAVASLVALLASAMLRVLIKLRSALIAIILIDILGFFMLPSLMCTPSPETAIVNLYNDGIRSIEINQYEEGLLKLKDYSTHEWLLDVWRIRPYHKIDPYVAETGDIFASLDGGILSQQDISDCMMDGTSISIGYEIRPLGSWVILVNIFSDGPIYILTRNDLQPTDMMINDDPNLRLLSNDLANLFQPVEGNRAIKYECSDCYTEVITAFLQEPAFKQNSSIRMGGLGNLEYYNICCNGLQVNGYWQSDPSNLVPPWSVFQQAVLQVVSEAIDLGETIPEDTYLNDLKEAQLQYGFRSLTGYEWSKYYIERYL